MDKTPWLPFKYLGEKSLYKNDGLVGATIQMDKATRSKDKRAFARVMVEVGIQQTLSDCVAFVNKHGVVMEQWIEYEWKPILCGKCSGYGHDAEACRKANNRKVWV